MSDPNRTARMATTNHNHDRKEQQHHDNHNNNKNKRRQPQQLYILQLYTCKPLIKWKQNNNKRHHKAMTASISNHFLHNAPTAATRVTPPSASKPSNIMGPGFKKYKHQIKTTSGDQKKVIIPAFNSNHDDMISRLPKCKCWTSHLPESLRFNGAFGRQSCHTAIKGNQMAKLWKISKLDSPWQSLFVPCLILLLFISQIIWKTRMEVPKSSDFAPGAIHANAFYQHQSWFTRIGMPPVKNDSL